jgi:hypothetical protein
MTATKTKPETDTYTFTSVRTELLVNVVPDLRKHHADGTSELVHGKWVQFEHGQFVADPESAEKVGYDSAEELADALRRHSAFDSDFYEIKVEPVAPDHTDTLIRVATLIASGDLEALFALEAEEREGWAREPILTAIEGAVEALKARAAAEQPEE